MIRILLLLGLLVLAGCAHREPVSCDGSDRRPINPGKWDPSMSFGGCGLGEIRP